MKEIFGFIYRQNLWILAIVCVAFILLWAKLAVLNKNLTVKIANAVLLSVSVAVIIYETIILREYSAYEPILIPFKTLIQAKAESEYYRTFFMNILLFVPIGVFMPYVLSRTPKKRNIIITICSAFIFSITVEFLQYKFLLGLCETDDVIANTLGAAVGSLSYCYYMRLRNNFNKKEILMHYNFNNTQKSLMSLCAYGLFGKDFDKSCEFDVSKTAEEAKKQTVFPTVYSAFKKLAIDDSGDDNFFKNAIAKNIRVEYAHFEIHKLLSENNVPYVILKGVSSASYYKEPLIRTMGDIDFLVNEADIGRADRLLRSAGYVTDDDINSDRMHIGYKKKNGNCILICEMHRTVCGIPNNQKTEIIEKYLSDIIETSVEYAASGGVCRVPDKFHHGLILLLHTAEHLTHEGVGLRHLCDWAVFVNGIDDDEFTSLFEKPLKEAGLWRFAQLLTLCCVKYLGCEPKYWAGEASDELIDSMIADILNGGNFGQKDFKRYSQIKYISNRDEGSVSKRNPVLELFYSINSKTKSEVAFVNKSKLLLPIGWVITTVKYFGMVINGRRDIDGVSTINDAVKRKNIYSEFQLFEDDK